VLPVGSRYEKGVKAQLDMGAKYYIIKAMFSTKSPTFDSYYGKTAETMDDNSGMWAIPRKIPDEQYRTGVNYANSSGDTFFI